jgi:hypothetical protein
VAQEAVINFAKLKVLPNHPAYFNKDTALLLPIEQVSALTIEGVRKSRTYIILDSVRSPFRVKISDELKLVIKPGMVDASNNPFAAYRLYALKINERKKHREYLSVTETTGMMRSSTEPNLGLPIEMRTGENGIYLLLCKNLSPGEYALRIADVIYSFGVD